MHPDKGPLVLTDTSTINAQHSTLVLSYRQTDQHTLWVTQSVRVDSICAWDEKCTHNFSHRRATECLEDGGVNAKLKEVAYFSVQWFQLSQNRVKNRADLNTVMNHRISRKAGNFIPSSAIISGRHRSMWLIISFGTGLEQVSCLSSFPVKYSTEI
jgi:hypothetical protein